MMNCLKLASNFNLRRYIQACDAPIAAFYVVPHRWQDAEGTHDNTYYSDCSGPVDDSAKYFQTTIGDDSVFGKDGTRALVSIDVFSESTCPSQPRSEFDKSLSVDYVQCGACMTTSSPKDPDKAITRRQGLTLVHLSAQPEPFLTQTHTLHTP